MLFDVGSHCLRLIRGWVGKVVTHGMYLLFFLIYICTEGIYLVGEEVVPSLNHVSLSNIMGHYPFFKSVTECL